MTDIAAKISALGDLLANSDWLTSEKQASPKSEEKESIQCDREEQKKENEENAEPTKKKRRANLPLMSGSVISSQTVATNQQTVRIKIRYVKPSHCMR